MGGRFTTWRGSAPCTGLYFGWRNSFRPRPRPVRHRSQRGTADPYALEHGFRRVPLALAVFPARSSDRDPDLDPVPSVQHSARTLAGPALRCDRRGIAADNRSQGITTPTVKCRGKIALDFRYDADSAIDHSGIKLQQRCAGLDLPDRCRAGIDSADANQRK